MRLSIATGIGVVLLSVGTISGGVAQAQDTFPVPAEVIQVLPAFDNPEGAIFSADGGSVFVSNAAAIGDRGEGFGWAEGEGY